MNEGDKWKDYPTESRLLITLKKSDGMSLEELSEALGISKVATLKHIKSLENRHILERRITKKKVGRPYYRFYLLSEASSAFGSSSDRLFNDLLEFIAENGNREIVIKFLNDRYEKVAAYYKEALRNKSGKERVEELARLRLLENYLPELKSIGRDKHELLEFNCPIYSISSKFAEACDLEKKLFENVLRMRVNTSHTQVNGYGTCRFLIDRKSKDEL